MENSLESLDSIKSIKSRSKTLILIDWDDTLFPTTWVGKNKIDVATKLLTNRLHNFFSKLDVLLYKLLQNLSKCGKVIIVTNASKKWVDISARILPFTKNLIDKRIIVLSARDLYKWRYPSDMYKWKQLVFKNLVTGHIKRKQNINHVISIGDADYEHQALIKLNDKKLFSGQTNRHILKSVKLIKYPSLELLLDQLILLNKSIINICESSKHMDLKFSPIQGSIGPQQL